MEVMTTEEKLPVTRVKLFGQGNKDILFIYGQNLAAVKEAIRGLFNNAATNGCAKELQDISPRTGKPTRVYVRKEKNHQESEGTQNSN